MSWIRLDFNRDTPQGPLKHYYDAISVAYDANFVVIETEYATVRAPVVNLVAVFEYKDGFSPRGVQSRGANSD